MKMNMQDVLKLPKLGDKIDEFGPGDTVAAELTIVDEGDKERAQVFRGIVLRGSFSKDKRPPAGSTFVVRRVTYGIGIERTIPYYSPLLLSLKLEQRGRVRRARIYYLRDLSGKKARIRRRI